MEGREEGMESKLLHKRETTAWYLSYRRAGYTVMHIYTDKNSAIEAACHHLDGDHEREEISQVKTTNAHASPREKQWASKNPGSLLKSRRPFRSSYPLRKPDRSYRELSAGSKAA